MNLPELQCPHCHNHFHPELPPPPQLPPEVLAAGPAADPTTNTAIGINLVHSLLTGLRDSLKRQFGYTTTLTAADLTWTLTVAVPQQQPQPDDVTTAP